MSGTGRASSENLLLSSALWRAWGYRCYWCREPRDLLDVVIDQMIPRAQGRRPRSDARREPDPRTSSTSVQHRRSAQPGPHLPALQWREERREFFWDAPLYVTAGEGTHSGAASGKTLSQVSQEERVAFPLSAIGRTGGGGPAAWQPPKRRGPCRGGGADRGGRPHRRALLHGAAPPGVGGPVVKPTCRCCRR